MFQLIINGVGGNLVAVQASRISTSLHKDRKPRDVLTVCVHPFHVFFSPGKQKNLKQICIFVQRFLHFFNVILPFNFQVAMLEQHEFYL